MIYIYIYIKGTVTALVIVKTDLFNNGHNRLTQVKIAHTQTRLMVALMALRTYCINHANRFE